MNQALSMDQVFLNKVIAIIEASHVNENHITLKFV